MRMFLVGICDIFLMLYLMSSGQIDRGLVSELTVDDYQTVVESVEHFQSKALGAEERLAVTQKDASRLQMLLQEAQEAHLAELKALERIEIERKVTREAKEAEKLAKRLAQEETQRVLRLKENEKAVQQKIQQVVERESKALTLVQDAEKENERIRLEIEETKRKLEEAKNSALEALKQAKEANKREQEAQSLANEATKRGQRAVQIALNARKKAVGAQIRAHDARLDAKRALEKKEQAETKIKLISERGSSAFRQYVHNRLVPVTIDVRTKAMLSPTKKNTYSLRGLPVKFGKTQVVLFPLKQIGVNQAKRSKNYLRYNIAVHGLPITELYVSSTEPYLVAIVVGEDTSYTLPVDNSARLDSHMPTLIAVRNNSRMSFGDRIRDIDKSYFVFKRDRLKQNAIGNFIYNAKGIRGTRDFAEHVVSGDSIVDLSGRFIGIAANENTIVPISSLADWNMVRVAGMSAREIVSSIREVAK